jgi:hypothetical protein
LKWNSEHTKRRIGPFARLSKIWVIVFLSLLLDGVVAFSQIVIIEPERAQLISIICGIFILPFLNQGNVCLFLARIRGFQERNRNSGKAIANRLLVGTTVGGLILAKLLLLPSISNFLSLIVTGGLIFGIILSARHFISEAHKHSSYLRASPWLYIQLWERQILVLYILPIVAARCISLCGALSTYTTDNSIISAVYPIASAILLLALKPARSSFIGWCKKCKAPTPIAFSDYGSCPACDETLALNI